MRQTQDKSRHEDSRNQHRREHRAKFWHLSVPDPREESLWARSSSAASADWFDEWTLKPSRD